MKSNRLRNFFLNLFTVILSGLLTLMNFSEWYIVNIQGRTSEYQFGGEGPTPYYYKTAELYSKVNLIWAAVFFATFIFTTWTTFKHKKNLTLTSLGVTLFLLLAMFIHGQIGAN